MNEYIEFYRKVIPFIVFASALVSRDACTITQHESCFAEAAFCWFQSTGVLSIGIQTSGGTTRSARSVLSIFILTFQSCKRFIKLNGIINNFTLHFYYKMCKCL